MSETIIVLKCAYNKTPGMEYKIEPCADASGRMPSCVRKVDANGDMILSEQDIKDWTSGKKVFIKENEPIIVKHNTTFDLTNPLQEAQWEAIKNSPLIAKDRTEKDSGGNYIIDGGPSIIDHYGNAKGRYGLAELYIEHPGKLSEAKVSMAKLINKAENLIFQDSLAHQVLICSLYEKDMSHSPAANVEEYLLDQARRDPNKLIKFYNAEESAVYLLVVTAIKKDIIRRRPEGLYWSEIKLGSSVDIAVEYLKDPGNKALKESIKAETFPDMEVKPEKTAKK